MTNQQLDGARPKPSFLFFFFFGPPMRPTNLVMGETRSNTRQQQLESGQQQLDGAKCPLFFLKLPT